MSTPKRRTVQKETLRTSMQTQSEERKHVHLGNGSVLNVLKGHATGGR